jgi:hypothetical protein
MRTVILLAAILACTGCQQKPKSDLSIADAKLRAALSLSAFECSALATAPADSSRLFNAGLLAGRDFLTFADANVNGYKSIVPQIDPLWNAVADRPSADFKLGEMYAAIRHRVDAERVRFSDSSWDAQRGEWYAQKNCGFVGNEPVKK